MKLTSIGLPRPHRTTRRRTRRKRVVSGLAAFSLAMLGLVATSGVAGAVGADGPFTIDGTVPGADGAINLGDDFGNVKELGPLNSSTTKIGVIHNDAVPTLGLTNPNANVDLRQAWLELKRDPAAPNHDWIYFAWERDSNNGSGFIAYEFMHNAAPAACAYGSATTQQLIDGCNPWKNRVAGDFMILWDQQGNSKDLYLRTWSGTAPNLTLGPATLLNDTVSSAQYNADFTRGEAAVDLTATIGGGGGCLTLANTIPSTVTGNSDSADYKDTILVTVPPLSNCTSTTVTTPKDGAGADIPAAGLSIGTGVAAVKDSALVSIQGGTATPSGSVAFSLCKVDSPGLCGSGGTSVGSTSLSGASYPQTVVSPTAYVTSAGRYCWRAVFTGDSANSIPGSSDSRANECFTVNPVTPTLSTSAGADVNLGQAVTDSATLAGTATQPANPVINLTGTGGAAAGGTITFKLYGPSSTGCGTLVYTSPTVAVSGNNTYNSPAPQFVPTAAGNYHWVAVYSGNAPNTNTVTHNADCTDTDEDVTVTSVPSSMSTAQQWVPNDSATVSATAGGNMTGTVSFTLYPSSDCTGTAVFTESKSVSGASPQTVNTSNTTAVTASGPFSWKVSYDSTNSAQEDIGAKCTETSSVTINNGSTVSSP